MATQLSFSKDGNIWRTQYTSQGDTVVQLSRKGGGKVVVYAALPGMPMMPIGTRPCYDAGQYVMLRIAIPAGMEVAIESRSEVTKCALAQGGISPPDGSCDCDNIEITLETVTI